MKIEIISIEESIRVKSHKYQELLSKLTQLDNQNVLKVTCENRQKQGTIAQFLYRLPSYKTSRRIINGEFLIFVTKIKKAMVE